MHGIQQRPINNSDTRQCTADTIQEFNVVWAAECDQLNLAQVIKNKNI